jgi:hypothetical protein
MTMLKTGRMNKIADEMLKTTITNNSFTGTKVERSWANQQNQIHILLQLQSRKKPVN